MTNDDSILSAMSGSPSFPRVIAKMIETQQELATRFNNVTSSIDDIKSQFSKKIDDLAEDIRRMELRNDKCVESLAAAHASERAQLIAHNESLLALFKSQLSHCSSSHQPATAPQRSMQQQPQATAAMQAYNNAMSASAMFGGQGQQAGELEQYMAAAQQQQLMLRQLAAAQMGMTQQYGGKPPGTSPMMQGQGSLQQGLPSVPQWPQAPPPPSGSAPSAASSSSSMLPSFGKPAPPTSSLLPKVEQMTIKEEPKPAVVPIPTVTSAPTAPPKFSFGGIASSPSSNTTSSSTTTVVKPAAPLFGSATQAKAVTPAAAASPLSFKPKEPVAKDDQADDEDDDQVEEYEPTVDFAPVIPLPDAVETVTGEEDEEVLLEDRCKLYRFDKGEWKERGTGTIKVLKNKGTGKHRVVMRRDQMALILRSDNTLVAQVHKVAANFPLVAKIRVAPMPKAEKAVMWHCVDFVEEEEGAGMPEEGVHTQFSARFASPQRATEFMDTVNEIVDSLSDSGSPQKAETKKVEPAAKKTEEPKTTEKKVEEKKKEATPVPAATIVQKGWGDAYKPKPGSWECPGCYTSCTAEQAECPCCATRKDGGTGGAGGGGAGANPFGKNATIFNAAAASTAAPKFSFGMSASPAAAAAPQKKDEVTIPSASSTAAVPSSAQSWFKPAATSTPPTTGTVSFGGTPQGTTATTGGKLSFTLAAAGAVKEAEKKEGGGGLFGSSSSAFGGGLKSSTAAPSSASSTTSTPVSFSFKTAADPSSSSSNAASSSGTPSFSFKTPDPSKSSSIFGGSQKSLFGVSATPTTPVTTKEEDEKKETPTTVFGTSFMKAAESGTSGFAAMKGKGNIFEQKEKIEEGQKSFAGLAKSKPFGAPAASAAPAKNDDGDEGEGGNENPEEYEPDAQFAPVIPLPDLVEVKTGEEEEEVKFSSRAKIYRYVKENSEFKERGVGELKVLHNTKTNKFRVVMRREQVHKLCANFPILPDSSLQTRDNQPNVRTLVAQDFAEDMSGAIEMLAIRFKTGEIAANFETAFKDAKKALSSSSA